MWGEIVFLPLSAWQVVLLPVPSLHLHCLYAKLSSAMESRFHDSCAQPCCLQVSDNHQNKQLTQMLFLSSPFRSPLFPDLAPTTRIFLLSFSLFEKARNSCHPRASSGTSTDLLVWFLLSPLPFSMETVSMPSCISVCKEDWAQNIWAVDQQPPGCVPRKVEKRGLATQDYTSLAQGAGSLSQGTLSNTPEQAGWCLGCAHRGEPGNAKRDKAYGQGCYNQVRSRGGEAVQKTQVPLTGPSSELV